MELIIDGALVEGGTDTKAPLLETATIAERAGWWTTCVHYPAKAFELHTSRGTWPSQELETFLTYFVNLRTLVSQSDNQYSSTVKITCQ